MTVKKRSGVHYFKNKEMDVAALLGIGPENLTTKNIGLSKREYLVVVRAVTLFHLSLEWKPLHNPDVPLSVKEDPYHD